jgi:hypothetical protein
MYLEVDTLLFRHPFGTADIRADLQACNLLQYNSGCQLLNRSFQIQQWMPATKPQLSNTTVDASY